MRDGLQCELFPQRVRYTAVRHVIMPDGKRRRVGRETVLGSVVRRWRDLVLVQFDGRPSRRTPAIGRPKPLRGCLLQLHPSVLEVLQ